MGIPGEYHYSECTACGAIFQTPPPTPEEIASFYPEEYEPYKPGRPKEKNPIEKAVLRTGYCYTHIEGGAPDWLGRLAGFVLYRDSTPFTTDGRLLDIGCGGGKYLQSMQRLGWSAEGVEFNSSAVQTCRDMGLTVFHGELSDASFPDNTFDVVTARHVIEHISNPGPFIEEIFRILKPGGLMILRTPNSRALGRGWFGTNWFANDVPRHLILFSPKNLSILAERIWFQHHKTETFSSPKIILNSWDYLTHNRGRPSKKRKLRRMIARLYVAAAAITGRGDEIFCMFSKPEAKAAESDKS
jgi:2-polyprenyl-3-methyl-5-hydroxy-6-metoxy-1,4-benzoquinol methylase